MLAAKLKAQDFARCIEPEFIPPLHSNEVRKPGLYAAAGSFLEKGKRPYWLLLAKSKGDKATLGGRISEKNGCRYYPGGSLSDLI